MKHLKIVILITCLALIIAVTAYLNRHKIKDITRKTLSMNYFTIDELTKSETANRLGIDNRPSENIKSNINELIINTLNPLREAYGKPIIVSSGYRCTALNAAIGGVANSQHTTGEAADLVPSVSGENEINLIFEAAKKVPFDQLILEQNSTGKNWVHVSYSKNKQRGQVLIYENGTYTKLV